MENVTNFAALLPEQVSATMKHDLLSALSVLEDASDLLITERMNPKLIAKDITGVRKKLRAICVLFYGEDDIAENSK